MKIFHKIILSLFSLIILFSFSCQAKAMIIIGPPEPPPSCPVLTSPITEEGETFRFKSYGYENGYLVIKFIYNPQWNQIYPNPDSLSYHADLENSADCSYESSINIRYPSFPRGEYSIRFLTDSSYQIYNDNLNQPVSCDGCRIDFGEDLQDSFKVSFNFSAYILVNGVDLLPNILEIKNLDIREPIRAKTPVIIVPGIMGTEMKKGSDLLWADILRMVNPLNIDSFMDPLQFNKDLTPSEPEVYMSSIIGLKKFWPIVFDYSDGLIKSFLDQTYTEGTSSTATLFTFPYDWRYGVSGKFADGRTNADLLKQKIQEVMAQTGSDKVDIVAHSMGGLIVKKYVMDNTADNHIGKAVFVGVPNLGAPNAIKTLLEGDNFDIPFLDEAEMKKISQNMPAIYDLAPSQQYFDTLGSYLRTETVNLFNTTPKDLNYSEITDYLKNLGSNSQAMANSSDLHSTAYDNYDLRSAGVDLYNIVGCKTGTLGQLFDKQANGGHFIYLPNPDHEFSGDGTVPFGSADSLPVDGNNTFFAPKANHGKMLSQDGIRQEIVNLLTGSTLDTSGKILTHEAVQTNPKLCEVRGEKIKIKSPVSIGVTDQAGNFSGLAADGSIQNDIPGADYQIWGDHKYVFLPTDEGQVYNINLKGTGTGTFTLDDQSIEGNMITQTQVFSNLSVTPDLTGQVNLGGDSVQTTLSLQATPASVPVIVTPNSVLNPEESLDMTPPVSTSTISGSQGEANFYRSDVKILLSATDPNGILRTQYKLDNQDYQTYSSSTPIIVSAEGVHAVSFFSTDRAGNNELAQSISFTIDKSIPEFVFSVDPKIFELKVSGYDAVSSTTLTIKDITKKPSHLFRFDKNKSKMFSYSVSDLAGASSTMILEINRETEHKLNYDINFSNTKGSKEASMAFERELDKKGNLKTFTQTVRQGRDIIIYTYNVKKDKTIIRTRDGKQIDRKVYGEQKNIEFITSNGVIGIK